MIRCARIPASARRMSRGFTLIEMLIALMLLGLISMVLFGGLRFGTRAWETGEARADELAEIEAVQGLLRRQIAQIMMPSARPDARRRLVGAGTIFSGAPDRLRFVAHVPPHLGVGGIYLFEIVISDEGQRRQLDLVWHLYRPDEPDVLEEDIGEEETVIGGRRTLLEDIEDAAFAYYGAKGARTGADWHEQWDNEPGLPDLIAVKVVFPSGDTRRWPDLVVQTKLRPASDT